MIRRSFLVLASFLAASHSPAQRPANPIARPPRPAGPVLPGRFRRDTGGTSSVNPPSAFVVRDVNRGANTLRLGDADGQVEDVLVDEQIFDITTLKVGDRVIVDFLVSQDSKAPLRAASVWTE